MKIEDIIDRYRDDWVIVCVTDHDDDHWPARGYVVIHARTQQDALVALENLPPEQRDARTSDGPLYSFLAQPDIRPGPEFDALLAQLHWT